MTAPGAGGRAAPPAPPSAGEHAPDPVQPEALRVTGHMGEPTEAGEELHGGANADGPADPSSDRPRIERFGADTVPLRPSSERDAELEREERLRLVEAGSRRRSPLRRHRRLLLPGVGVIALLALVVIRIDDGSNPAASEPTETTTAVSAPRAQSARPSLASTHAVSGQPTRSGRPGRRRDRPGHRRRQARPSHHHRRAPHPVPTGTTPEVTAVPTPGPAAAPAPEPASAPETETASSTPAPAPTSSPEGTTAERSQVETQFGFEK